MFAVFVSGSFHSFWQNKRNDKNFLELLLAHLESIGIDSNDVEVKFFEGISMKPDKFSFNGDKTLNIIEQQTTIDESDIASTEDVITSTLSFETIK